MWKYDLTPSIIIIYIIIYYIIITYIIIHINIMKTESTVTEWSRSCTKWIYMI